MARRKVDQEAGATGAGDVGGAAADQAAGTAAAPAKKRRPRSKVASAGKAMAKAEALSAAGAQAMAELAGLQRSISQLVQGLTAMLDTQAAHEELLRAILKATTAPTEPENKLADLLAEIVAKLDHQTEQFRLQGSFLVRLPDALSKAIGEQMAAALAAVR